MLALCILTYMLFTICIGFVASRRIKGAKDFMVAGRSLPFVMNFTCVFATWFGAETVLSVSTTFTRGGLNAIPGDPFGASMCLVLVAVFFAHHFYRMNLLTIGDFFHKRFGKEVEIFASIAITLSYLGWTAAQLTALGLVMSVLGQTLGFNWMTINNCILIGALIVMLYTVLGGMWSVALTDIIQTVVIIFGLSAIAYYLADLAGGSSVVIDTAYQQKKLQLWPQGGTGEWIAFITAFITVAFGSIPQQDVFQRVTSAKNERTAFLGTLCGGMFYFVFAFVPIFIAFSAVIISPELMSIFQGEDERAIQSILPQLILDRTPFWAQVLFFGALLSAIMSTASGTLLAPSSLFVENVLRPLIPSINEKNMLKIMRGTLIFFAIITTYQAISSNKTMYAMVQGAYSVTLVGAFVPLVLGIYWPKANKRGAIISILSGLFVWAIFLFFISSDHYQSTSTSFNISMIPPQLAGLIASLLGMIVGSLYWKELKYPDITAFESMQTNNVSLGKA